MMSTPEQFFRSRVRRLVEREGQLLVLVSPPQKFGGSWVEIERGSERFLYAGPSGRPVFAEIGGQSSATYARRQANERPALAALAHARGSAL